MVSQMNVPAKNVNTAVLISLNSGRFMWFSLRSVCSFVASKKKMLKYGSSKLKLIKR